MATTGSLRLLVESDAEGNQGEIDVRAAVASLGDLAEWRVERLFPDDDIDSALFVVSTHPTTPLAAQDAFALAYALTDRPGIHQAEPDLPVRAYAPEEPTLPAGAFAAPPTPEDLAWARKAIRCDEAWARPPAAGGAARGAGIRIGHPDTGYSNHPTFGPELAALDLVHDHDFISDDDVAEDPLRKGILPLTRFPAHGTGTGSVMVGQGEHPLAVLGVAPLATLVPIRAVNSVVQFFDSDVARAVNHARGASCHVVSMSLGGKGFFGLYRAIERALDAGMIVMAAAGNHVRIITAPASYDNCIAVAATQRDDTPWDGSSRGADVEMSAPGSGVFGAAWRLEGDREAFLSVKHGTSYAVAYVAGVAALWLAHHGVADLRTRYPGKSLATAFRALVRTAGHRVPTIAGGWKADKFGVGIINADAVLAAPLPDPAAMAPAGGLPPSPPSGTERIAAAFGELNDDDVAERLAVLGIENDAADRYAPEILYHLLSDDRTAEGFVAEGTQAAGAFGARWAGRLTALASEELATRLIG